MDMGQDTIESSEERRSRLKLELVESTRKLIRGEISVAEANKVKRELQREVRALREKNKLLRASLPKK